MELHRDGYVDGTRGERHLPYVPDNEIVKLAESRTSLQSSTQGAPEHSVTRWP